MSTDTTAITIESPVAVEAAKPKATAKKTPTKAAKPKPKAIAKPVKAVAKAPKVRAIGDTDAPVAERRQIVVRAMIKMGATGATSARTADEISAKSGLTRFDVYGLLYHTNELQKSGYAKQAQLEGVRGLSYYLTAKGAKGYDPK